MKDQLTTLQKFGKTALWIGVSAALSYLIGLTTANPLLVGAQLTPIVNLVLVTFKNLVDPRVKNI